MAAAASVVAIVAVAAGLVMSAALDAPSGPAIVLAASLIFVTSLAAPAAAHVLRSR
jgi:ABC-type Mn2+/Zn2+ transport system permease subunit